jgi:Repeat of unknown function (DUF5648)
MSDHFYTTDEFERDRALAGGSYRLEIIACSVYPAVAGPAGTVPLFRLYNHDSGDHFYTTDANERDRAIARSGYRSEGVACAVFAAGNARPGLTALYRLWNGDESDHFYTVDPAENNRAQSGGGYRYEGIACFVFPPTGGPPGTVPLYRLYKHDEGLLDSIGDFFSGIGNTIVGAASTIGGALLDTFDSTFGWALDGLSWVLENTLFSVPGIGDVLRDLWNGLLGVGWGLIDVGEMILGFLGIRPEKRMRIMVIIQEDEEGHAVATTAEIFPLLQLAIDTFKGQANVRLLPVGPFRYSSPFQDIPTASEDYIYREELGSRADTLDVDCDADLLVDDLGIIGSQFNYKLSRDLFFAGWRRLIGYGAPVAAFAVRSFKNGHSAGCSLGPLADYVVVRFAPDPVSKALPRNRNLAHELGHACNLWHPSYPGGPDPNNLMTPVSQGGVGFELRTEQVVLLRASRHVTYF